MTNSANTVSAYSIAADGSLTQVSSSPFAARTRPGSVATTTLVGLIAALSMCITRNKKGTNLHIKVLSP